MTPAQVVMIAIRETDEYGRLKKIELTGDGWAFNAKESFKEYLWLNGITDPALVNKLYGERSATTGQQQWSPEQPGGPAPGGFDPGDE